MNINNFTFIYDYVVLVFPTLAAFVLCTENYFKLNLLPNVLTNKICNQIFKNYFMMSIYNYSI